MEKELLPHNGGATSSIIQIQVKHTTIGLSLKPVQFEIVVAGKELTAIELIGILEMVKHNYIPHAQAAPPAIEQG